MIRGQGVDTSPSNTLYQKTKSNPTISITSNTLSTVSLMWTDYNTYSSLVPFDSYVIHVRTNGGSWSTVTTINEVSQNTYTITGLDRATYAFRVYDQVGTSGQYKSYSDAETITIPEDVTVHIGSSKTSVNVGAQVLLTASVTGGTNSYSYQWYLNGNAISGAASSIYTYYPSNSGTDTIYVTVTDSNTLLSSATSNSLTITVTSTPAPNPVTPELSPFVLMLTLAIAVAIIALVKQLGKKPQQSTFSLFST